MIVENDFTQDFLVWKFQFVVSFRIPWTSLTFSRKYALSLSLFTPPLFVGRKKKKWKIGKHNNTVKKGKCKGKEVVVGEKWILKIELCICWCLCCCKHKIGRPYYVLSSCWISPGGTFPHKRNFPRLYSAFMFWKKYFLIR